MSFERAGSALAAAALVLLSVGFVRGHTREDSLSADEPVHILSGYFAVAGRTAIVNIEHPPLAKSLAGLALLRLPLPPPPDDVPMGTRFTDYGHRFLFENRVSPDAIAATARAPFLLVLALLLGLVFWAARRRYGSVAGLFALALVALDPNFVAHAGVVHTDVGACVGFLATVLAWEAVRSRATPGRLAAAALALGFALATKFSAILLLPILLLQSLLSARRDARPGAAAGAATLRLAGVVIGALLVVVAIYAPLTTRMDPEHQRQVIHEMVAGRGAPRLSAAIESLVPISRPLAHWLGGLGSVLRQSEVGGGVNYLLGKTSVKGFPSYFFVAFAVKSTLAFLATTGIVLALFLRRRAEYREEIRLYLVPVAVIFLASIGSAYNIGVRHVLPAYPFLALAGASLFPRALRWGRPGEETHPSTGGTRVPAGALALALLPLVSAVELAWIHPHELSYFNPLAGGPERGRFIVADSNVDWGLDLKRLARELSRRGIEDPTVAYFGGDDVFYRTGVPDFVADPGVRGRVVAISAFYLAVGPEFHEYHGARGVAAAVRALLTRVSESGRPAGRVGYSMYLFELPPSDNSSNTEYGTRSMDTR